MCFDQFPFSHTGPRQVRLSVPCTSPVHYSEKSFANKLANQRPGFCTIHRSCPPRGKMSWLLEISYVGVYSQHILACGIVHIKMLDKCNLVKIST
jgi:hypothetical protein